MEFRYYQMSAGSPILALLGQKWVQNYGMMWIIFTFIIILRLDTAMVVTDLWCWVKRKKRFYGGIVTVIPPNYPHTTNSDIGTVSKWEYLFIDVEGFMKKFWIIRSRQKRVIQRIYSRALFFEEKEEFVYLEKNPQDSGYHERW